MRRQTFFRLSILAICAAILLSCKKDGEKIEISGSKVTVFYANIAEPGAGEAVADAGTKTVTENGRDVLWVEGDKVSIFRGENINDEYAVKEGFGGKTTTTLVKVEDGSFRAGNETVFDANIAYYPYSNIAYNGSNGAHSLLVPIPDVQKYVPNSFGAGAFPMVAVSSDKADNKLPFRNLFGAIKLRIKSPNYCYKVKDITVKGNNNEKFSGEAVVKCSSAETPTVTFVDGKANDYVKLDCGDGVEILPGGEAEFWIALPPATYEKGINVTVNLSNGESLQKNSEAQLAIERSVVTPMALLEVDTEYGELYFPDKHFRNALLSQSEVKVDMDGDGFITAKDLKAWTEEYEGKDVEFIVGFNFIKSLKGIEYFKALTSLSCMGNEIETMDLSQNTALKKLNCRGNYNLVLDLSKNTNITWLDYSATATKDLDLSKLTALEYLNCESNHLTKLDVSKNTSLKTLICCDNELTELDVSKNTALDYLNCATNKLSCLNISKNTALLYLNCNYNNVAKIEFGDSPVLEELRCQGNQLTELDLSKFSALSLLDCGYNQMTTLDVSTTAIGSGKESMPLSCRMESLKTLYLKTGWEIKYITVDRFKSFIHENTVIEYRD